ncbi:MAG: hypothetical protein WBM44_29955 [Waterburya sp.]
MNAHRIETALTENGKLSLKDLPFKKGDQVEIVIVERNPKQKIVTKGLKGTVLKYEEPFESATSDEDWEVLM